MNNFNRIIKCLSFRGDIYIKGAGGEGAEPGAGRGRLGSGVYVAEGTTIRPLRKVVKTVLI